MPKRDDLKRLCKEHKIPLTLEGKRRTMRDLQEDIEGNRIHDVIKRNMEGSGFRFDVPKHLRTRERMQRIHDELVSQDGGGLFSTNIYQAPPAVKKALDKYGDAVIERIEVNRRPLDKGTKILLNLFSKGGDSFSKEASKLPYDDLYHLGVVFKTNKGRVTLEKTERVTMVEKPHIQDVKQVSFPQGLTIRQIYEKTKTYMGKKFFEYDAGNNNCQDFVIALLKANNLGDQQLYGWVKQDTSALVKNDPRLFKRGRAVTDMASYTQNFLGMGF